MGTILLLYAIFLVYLWQMQGSSAVTPVFVQKGKDVFLNVTTADVPENFIILQWKYNQKVVLVTYFPANVNVSQAYTGRIETDVKNYSAKLKNVQDADSGVYSATVTGAERVQMLAEYNVTVQGPVSPVELSVDSVSSSSDSCNLTVTCRTQDSHISSTVSCDNQTCSQEGGERSEVTTSGASLHVYLLNDSIICNHSNHVSWAKDIKMTEYVCLQHNDPDKQGNNFIVILLVSVIPAIIAFLIVVFTVMYCHQKTQKYDRENAENTVYATPQIEATTQGLNQRTTDDSLGLSPTSTYSFVGPHLGPVGTTERDRTLPETLYDEVQVARS